MYFTFFSLTNQFFSSIIKSDLKMDNFFNILFKDPILIISTLVLVVTAAILLWSLKSIKKLNDYEYDNSSDDNPIYDNENTTEIKHETTKDNNGISEARILQVNNQLDEINQRLSLIEKNTALDLESQLNAVQKTLEILNDKNTSSISDDKLKKLYDSISEIESKVDGIYKLLIILTDSGTTPK